MMAGEENLFLEPLTGLLGSIIPALELIFLLAIVSLVWFIIWKKKPFQKFPATVLLLKKRGDDDFSPELTKGRSAKNKEGEDIYKLKNGDEIPTAMFKDLRNFGKGTFSMILEEDRGKYAPAPSPFKAFTNGDGTSQFTQSDANWLISQHKNNIRMFEKKGKWKELLQIAVPLITIFVVIFALVLFVQQVFIPLTAQASSIASSNYLFIEKLGNITERMFNMSSNSQPLVVPGLPGG